MAPAMPRASTLVPAALTVTGLLLAACGSSGPENTGQPTANTNPTSTRTVVPGPTPAGLPYHYATLGESSSPSFHVATAGTYTVAYVVKGSAGSPACTVSIALTADDGTAQQVLSGVVVKPTDTRPGSVQVSLTASNWRFQEGGGCSWDVTVSPG
jgi:hypothetical protein